MALGLLAAAASGLIAKEEVNVEGESRDMLKTQPDFVATSMAIWRSGQRRPNAIYVGAASQASVWSPTRLIWAASWSTTKAPASRGVFRNDVANRGQLGAFFSAAVTDFLHGVQHMSQEAASGKIVSITTEWFAKRFSAKR